MKLYIYYDATSNEIFESYIDLNFIKAYKSGVFLLGEL